MRDFKRFELIDAVEIWAAENGCISSEDELSELFDEEILPFVIAQYGESDQCAIDQAFNGWSDSLCKDDQLHSEQYNTYCYVGVKSDV